MDNQGSSMITQDLQLIQEIIGELPPAPIVKTATPEPTLQKSAEDLVDSSDNGSDTDSEREVEADILGDPDIEDESTPSSAGPTTSRNTSDSESSSDPDSDSDDGVPFVQRQSKVEELLMDDDEEGGTIVSPDQARTKNEVADVSVVIPEVDKVEEDETLEKVGEILTIVDKVVIVKGLPQQVQGRVSDRALDSDTLLVFEDRKVLGYIWETFGPTAQPFYRIQFNEAYPLDPEKIRVAREVFHVPARSKFVSVSFLKQYRGSDASNAHDEEPAAEELEFSDDEAEREHKRSLKERRSGLDSASRHTTPMPSRSKDEDMIDDLYGASPYDGAPYDNDLHAGPSRPPPMAYDDPYSASYGLPDPSPPTGIKSEPAQQTANFPTTHQPDRARGRGRGRGAARDGPGRDRGRGRGRGARERGRGRGRGRGGGGMGERDNWSSGLPQQGMHNADGYNSQPGRGQSPTSAAIARATGQYSGDSAYAAMQQPAAPSLNNGWGYQQQQYPAYGQGDYNYEFQQPFVQPHINPRFASQFGLNFGYAQSMHYAGYPQYDMGYSAGGQMSGGNWTDGGHGQHPSNPPDGDNGPAGREPP